MVKCKDGRKHIIVNEYKREDDTRVRTHERSCPATTTTDSKNICCICGEEHGLDDLHDVEIKGKTKKLCEECVDTVHGLI